MEIRQKSHLYSDFTIDRYNRNEISKERFVEVMKGLAIFDELTEKYAEEEKECPK